jgi:hypothetical protein
MNSQHNEPEPFIFQNHTIMINILKALSKSGHEAFSVAMDSIIPRPILQFYFH